MEMLRQPLAMDLAQNRAKLKKLEEAECEIARKEPVGLVQEGNRHERRRQIAVERLASKHPESKISCLTTKLKELSSPVLPAVSESTRR